MDKSTARNGQKVKKNSRYQKDMERSFAVIYYNLKRIQDEKPSRLPLSHKRHNSEPQIPNPELLRKYEQTPSRERSYSETTKPPGTRDNKRRVSFSQS